MATVIEKAKDAVHMGSRSDVEILGEKVNGTGYGLMGLTWRANPPSQEQAFAAMSTFGLLDVMDIL